MMHHCSECETPATCDQAGRCLERPHPLTGNTYCKRPRDEETTRNKHALAFVLRHVDKKTYVQISTQLGVTPSCVHVWAMKHQQRAEHWVSLMQLDLSEIM